MDRLLVHDAGGKFHEMISLTKSIEDLVTGLKNEILGAGEPTKRDLDMIYGSLDLVAHTAHSIYNYMNEQLEVTDDR